MRPFLYLSALVAVVCARPEPPVGYNYPSPSSFPSQQYGTPTSGLSLGGFQGFGASGSGIELGHGGQGGFSGVSQGGFSGVSQGGFSGGFAQGPSVIQSGPATVHKHVYVHVAPEEPEEVRPQRPVVVGAPQKHYKIIFIKAPAPPAPVAPVIPVQPQNEEKTLVYVLVKKPEEQPEIVVPQAQPTQPTKPEVYFIKYNTRKDSVSGGAAAAAGGADAGLIGGGQIDGGLIGGGGSISDATLGAHGAGSISGGIGGAAAGVSSKYGPPGYQH